MLLHFTKLCVVVFFLSVATHGFAEDKPIDGIDLKPVIEQMKAGKFDDQRVIEVREELSDKSLSQLFNHLNDDNAEMEERWFSAILLARLGGKESFPYLVKSLSSKPFIVRMAAIKGLELVGDPAALPKLHASLTDKAMVVRAAAANSLGAFASRESLPFLIEALNNADNFYKGRSMWVRKHIIEAIGQIGGENAVASLIPCLQEQEVEIRKQAVLALNPVLDPTLLDVSSGRIQRDATEWVTWWQKDQNTTHTF